MIERMRQLLRREDGAVELFVALSLVVILGITALVVDVGNAKQARRNFQTAADSGSLAGAQNLLNAGTPATAEAFAAHYAFDSMNQPRGSSIGCPGSPYPTAPTGAVCYQSGTSGAVVYVTTPYTCPTTGATAGSGTCATSPDAGQYRERHGLPEAEYQLRPRPQDQYDHGLQLRDICLHGFDGELCPLRHEHHGQLHLQLGGNAGLTVTGVPPGPITVNSPTGVCGGGSTTVTSPGGILLGWLWVQFTPSKGTWNPLPVNGPQVADPLRNVPVPSLAGSSQTARTAQLATLASTRRSPPTTRRRPSTPAFTSLRAESI